MQDLIEYVAKSLVERPDVVELKITPADGGKIYELKVAPEDIGKVIGRDGRTINAIRTLVSAGAQRAGERARLEIIDDRRSANYNPNANAAISDGSSVAAPTGATSEDVGNPSDSETPA